MHAIVTPIAPSARFETKRVSTRTVQDYVPATWKEIYDTLGYHPGVATINPTDYQQILKHANGNTFDPITEAHRLRLGFCGSLQNPTGPGCNIWVARVIPPGYYYPDSDFRFNLDTIPPDFAHTIAQNLLPLIESP